jgi:hypothetical protein
MSTFGAQYYFLSLYYQGAYGYSVLQAGAAFLPNTVITIGGIYLGHALLRVLCIRTTIISGLVSGTIGFALLLLTLPVGKLYFPLLPGMILLSIG